jgi:hypothetical protein
MPQVVRIGVDRGGCSIDPGGGEAALCFEWSSLKLVGRFSDRQAEDGWIPWEPGCEWKASWDDARRYWVMTKLRHA